MYRLLVRGQVVNLPTASSTELKNNFLTRRTAVDFGVPLLTNAQLFKMFAESMKKHKGACDASLPFF